MKKIALFDFCNTLVTFQTADNYVEFIRKRYCNNRMHIRHIIYILIKRLGIIRIIEILVKEKSINKRMILWQLKGFSKIKLEQYAKEYYRDKIKPKLCEPIMKELYSLKSQGYDIYLVSGGYSIYLQYFVKEFQLKGMIASEINFNKGYCTGTLRGEDCMGKNKTKRLDLFFKEIEKKKKGSVAYSDSKSDLPLLLWAEKGIAVSVNKPQEWVKEAGLEEIVWKS